MSDTKENLLESRELKIKRYYWIDHARGFIMILLVVALFLPIWITEGPARFFLAHPENQQTTTLMNLYDIGVPAFIFIMGFLMPLSFTRRKERDGVKKAVIHMVIRYCIILGLGLLIFIVDGGYLIKESGGELVVVAGIPVIRWDVLPSLGLVGLIAIPFLWLKPKLRGIVAAGLLIFYQIMLLFSGWREYAIESIHGGILGTIFGLSVVMIWATCFGELLFVNEKLTEKRKYQIYALGGIVCLIIGLLIMIIPDWYPNKRQITLTYILISTGVTILASFVFIGIDKKLQKPIFILDSYGKSPFLIYVISVLIEFLIVDLIGYEMDLLVAIPMIIVVTVIAILIDIKGKIVKL